MKYFALRTRRLLAFIFGAVYVFSGLSKLLDPVGAALVMDSYFDFLHIGFLSFAAKPVAVFFALAEAVVGAALMTGVWRRIMAVVSFAMQGFFTLLTVILVIFSPEMDCGCFGNVAHLSHTQSLVKNLILCLLLVGAFVPFREFGEPKPRKYVSFSIVCTAFLGFSIWSWLHIPLIDYTEFVPGALLRSAEAAETIDSDMYESVFIYEKDGKQETFTLDALPDSSWTYVDTQTVLKDGKEDSSVVLSIYDREGEYHDEVLSRGKVMVVSVYDPESVKWTSVAEFVAMSRRAGFRTVILVSANMDAIYESIKGLPEGQSLYEDMYMSDYKTLVSMNRSNSGVTFFSEGYLITKWAMRSILDEDSLAVLYSDDETEIMVDRSSRGRLVYQGFKLFVFGLMLLV